ncbi:hypothetical protein G6F37_014189 [Rhizopus arrhizus]|nr:hypothetical protein G6F38_014065 [Rhizopus arrhizus]KAG1127886.1 hypothetical protein G6F37_014189 [Rhizopus arrhizus]
MERQVESGPERQSMVESGLPFEDKDVKVEEDTEVYAVSISAIRFNKGEIWWNRTKKASLTSCLTMKTMTSNWFPKK